MIRIYCTIILFTVQALLSLKNGAYSEEEAYMSSYDSCLHHLSDHGEKYFVTIYVSRMYNACIENHVF